jgi:hypothetical protein
MFLNRLSSAVPAQPIVDPSPSPEAFLLVPVICLPLACPAQDQLRQSLYELALAKAKAVVRPSILERDLLAVWN